MLSEYAVQARALGKCYSLFDRPGDRLKQLLWGRWHRYDRDFWALRDVSFDIRRGEVVGIVGRNGAGKSTLLQMVCGTLSPTCGSLAIEGRVAALLELGAGFNPDFTGLENVYMNAAILGLSRKQVDEKLDDILSFADIGDFIHQPVKTYSSGMFMRLAFAVATSVEPDILVIDEALSVGDGAFARKSFDRIMRLKDAGKTILFCSHSMYQVEALCSRALWIEAGAVRMAGNAAEVTSAYSASLNGGLPGVAAPAQAPTREAHVAVTVSTPGTGRITRISASADGASGRELKLRSGQSDLRITIDYAVDPGLPEPSVALGIADSNGLTIASATSRNDGVVLARDERGIGSVAVTFTQLPLLKGTYRVTFFLACENAVHLYEQVDNWLVLNVSQDGIEQGLVTLPHQWQP